MTIQTRWLVTIFTLMASAMAAESAAQVLGTFRWQFAPYCNMVTLSVEQKGAGYLLTGTDDLCGGAPTVAAATGAAHINPNGTATLAITVVRPDGIAIIHSARLVLPSLGGTWTDNFGNSGTLIFNPSSPTGPRRPVTMRGNYAVDFVTLNPLGAEPGTGASAFNYGMTLATAPVAHLVGPGTTTPECQGTSANPQAAPGHLCVYTSLRLRTGAVCVASTVGGYACDVADRAGAAVVVLSVVPGGSFRVFHVGTWAVTAPD